MSSIPAPPRSGSGRRSIASVAVAILILVLPAAVVLTFAPSAPQARAGEDPSTPANPAAAANPASPTPAPVDDRDVVVLLHGLARTPRSMRKLEKELTKAGYRVENIGYPSTKHPIEELAELLHERLLECCASRGGKLHFVTHSMGGIVLRLYAATRTIPDMGRAVMLSPPNSGSELVDAWKKIPFARKGIGPSRGQLGTDPDSVPRTIGPVDFEVGVITGDRSLIPFFSWLIPGPDDGMVAVERARVEGMVDFLVVPHTHTFIMNSGGVIDQTKRFLREGSFEHDDDEASS